MKQCRTCLRSYDDDSYQFCHEDGLPLSPVFDANATLVLNDSLDLDVTLNLDDLNTKRKRVFIVKNKPTQNRRHTISSTIQSSQSASTNNTHTAKLPTNSTPAHAASGA